MVILFTWIENLATPKSIGNIAVKRHLQQSSPATQPWTETSKHLQKAYYQINW